MPQLMERARECLESNCPKQALKILKKISTYETQDQRADVLYVFYKFLNFSTLSLSLNILRMDDDDDEVESLCV